MAHASICDVSGATSQSCKITRAIRNVHNQSESAVVNVLRPFKFKTIPRPQILDAWQQWCNTGRVFVTLDVLAIFGHLFARVPGRILTSDFHHLTLRKMAYKVRDYDFEVQFSFTSWTNHTDKRCHAQPDTQHAQGPWDPSMPALGPAGFW